MNFLTNFALNLKATGSVAVIAVWIICVTLLGVFGNGSIADSAMNILAVAGGGIIVTLSLRS